MQRVYCHYSKWEDWRAGQYRPVCLETSGRLIDLARELLANPPELKRAMRRASMSWPNAAAVNLTNQSRNRQAWLGQAACCMVHGSPEDVTKAAWWTLSDDEKDAANAVADQIIADWEKLQIEREAGNA